MRLLFFIRLAAIAFSVFGLAARCAAAEPPLLLAHYMPWFGSKEISRRWGWHWTMGKFDPEKILPDGRRQIASHDYPLIGPYDSGDPHALECQVLLMKFAGLDGAVVDWYGTQDFNDYARNHRNTQQLIPWIKKAGLRFAICYEDQAIGHAIKGGKLSAAEAVTQGQRDLQWAEQHWFRDPAYVKLEGRPVLLVFGPQHFQREQWQELRAALPHLVKQHGLDGAFGWPPVSGGKAVPPEQWRADLQRFHARRKAGERIIAAAFPGFHDIYRQAGVHDSYGRIEARDGRTFSESLDLALASGASLVQIATWNDYGEGTVIEPSRGHGYRYLETVQQRANDRHQLTARFTAAELRLPVELHQLRKQHTGNVATAATLDKISALLFASNCTEARLAIEQLKLQAR